MENVWKTQMQPSLIQPGWTLNFPTVESAFASCSGDGGERPTYRSLFVISAVLKMNCLQSHCDSTPARLALAMFVKVLETAHHMEEDDFEIKILWLGTASNLDVNVVKWKQKLAGGPGCLCWWATSLGGYPRTSKRSTQIPILDLHSKLTASLVSESEWRFENVLIFGCIDCFSWFHFWQWWKFPCIASQTRHTKPWRPRVQMTGGALGWHVLESRPAGMAAPAVSKREVVAKHVKPHITLPATYIYFFLMLKVEN